MRLFAALVPPEPVLTHLDEFLDVRREQADLRWTQPDQVHVTLAFMGQAPERALDDLVERLESAVRRRTAFQTRIAGVGAFPDVGQARVLWADVELKTSARTELDRLSVGCRTAGSRAGIDVDGGHFRPHLTLARTRAPHDVTRWVRLLDSYVGPPWTADRVVLVESHLGEGTRGRPRYETVAELAMSRP